MNAEQTRLEQARDEQAPWKKWGPYLSERQWGTVREDYSQNSNAKTLLEAGKGAFIRGQSEGEAKP